MANENNYLFDLVENQNSALKITFTSKSVNLTGGLESNSGQKTTSLIGAGQGVLYE